MHSSILLDADPSQLEPFPLALIMNEKQESARVKSGSENMADHVESVPATENSTGNSSESEAMVGTPTTISRHENAQVMTKPASNMSDTYSNLSILTPASSGYGHASQVSSPSVQETFADATSVASNHFNDTVDTT
jgi:hypothetical protein